MLPAERRVRRREEFTSTVRAGRRVAASGLVMYLRTDASSGPARAGFIVGRAVGPAVRRNRLRRQLRHLVAPRLATLPDGTAVVLRVTPAAVGVTGRQLGATLDALIGRAMSAAPC